MPAARDATASLTRHGEHYETALSEYLANRGEAALYRASLLSRAFVEEGLGPEEIVGMHMHALERAAADHRSAYGARAEADALHFLLEVMIAYGVQHQRVHEADERAARARQRAADAERAEKEKEEILAMIAHELRTPITAGMASLQLGQRLLGRGDAERAAPHVENARDAFHRLSRLSTQLAEASRGGPSELALAPQDVVPLLEQAVGWAASAAEEAGLTITAEPGPPSVTVMGNADALVSVFDNLLSNAIRYTPPGGRVTVRYGARPGEAWVEVADTGLGMTPDVRARIFEKFYRAPDARKRRPTGLGLGLTLVQRLVLAHGGRLEIESAPGRGSTFRVVLPSRVTDA